MAIPFAFIGAGLLGTLVSTATTAAVVGGTAYAAKKIYDKVTEDDSDSSSSYDSEEIERKNEFKRKMAEGKAKAAAKRKKIANAKSRLNETVHVSLTNLAAEGGIEFEESYRNYEFDCENFEFKDFKKDFEHLDNNIKSLISYNTRIEFSSDIERTQSEIERLTDLRDRITFSSL